MAVTHSALRRAWLFLVVAVWPLPGCIGLEGGGERLFNSLRGVETIVVAPAMNPSTSTDIEMIEFTNALASELQQVEGLNVVPIGRVYQYLSSQKMATVGSVEEAKALAEVFKAQATIVAAITEYDPYDPPRMGLAVQLYAVSPLPAPTGTPGFDPVAASRSAVPFEVTDDLKNRPRDDVQRIFSGRSLETEKLAQLYAKRRMADDTPFGWRRFLIDQREFQRLCCYGVIREMLGELGRVPQKTEIKIAPDRSRWPK